MRQVGFWWLVNCALKPAILTQASLNQLPHMNVVSPQPPIATPSPPPSPTTPRISYTFGMSGPSLSIDTACSSSLVAARLAHQTLLGQGPAQDASPASAALVGGINAMLMPSTTGMFKAAGMLAPDGRCKTLDAAADGYVRSEGAAMMLAAVGSHPGALAILAGSAVNQDGRSSGLTAPNGPAQQEVVRSALAAAGLAPSDVSGLQLHGTGTGLGDPIEVGAALQVFADAPSSAAAGVTRPPLQLLAAKSVLGHSEPASGLIGLLFAAHQLAAQSVVPVLHLRTLNPHITSAAESAGVAAGGGLAIPRAGAPLVGGGCSLGVSAFAFQVSWFV
jgi:acyl transferase domain-containing protein